MKKAPLALLTILMLISVLGTCLACSSLEGRTAQTTQTVPAPAASENPAILRLAIPSPKGDSIVNNAEKFAADFNARAGGKYFIEIYPGESLIRIGDSLDVMRTGAVEMDVWPIGFFASMDDNFAASEIPFVVNSVRADAAYSVAMMPFYESIMMNKFNCKPLYVFTGMGMDLVSTKEVKSAADWEGLLVQSNSPQVANFVQLMGAAGVPLSFPDVYQGMQKKIIEASMQSTSMMIAFNMQEVSKYLLSGYLTPSSIAVTINLDVYNRMPKDIQDLLESCGQRAMIETNNYYISTYDENQRILAGKGMTVSRLNSLERATWANKLQPYIDELYSKMDADFAARVKAISAQLDKDYPYQE